MACINPHSIVLARNDEISRIAIKSADLIVPDGIGIVVASKILGGEITTRVTGSDIFSGVNEHLNNKGRYRIFFLGSTKETLNNLVEKMADKYPNIIDIGIYSPPIKEDFDEEDNRKIVNAINSFKPDILWVCLTTPMQERWIYQNKDRLNVKCIGAVGDVFNFFADSEKMSTPFGLTIGLEALPRLLQAPRRLWHHTFISVQNFLSKVLLQRFYL
jgi:N-acetylglucosaminyldiphosphoundecaprenol N-acetyl-beta-D-mannosaminyltransferase